MHPSAWLDSAFGSEARVRILRSLVGAPGAPRSEREIAAAIGMSPNTVNKAVRSLNDAGLISLSKIGRAHAVRLSTEPLIEAALRRIFATEARLWTVTRQVISSALPEDVDCYLYGSTVAGTARSGSDIDLLVIAADHETAITAAWRLQQAVTKQSPARLQVIALSSAEAEARLALGEGLVHEAITYGEHFRSADSSEIGAA